MIALGLGSLFMGSMGYAAITDSVDVNINEEKIVNALLNHPDVSRFINELRAEMYETGQDRRRLVESVIRGIDSVVSDCARLTDAYCFLLYCVGGITVLLGAVWAHKLYSQSLRERANRVIGK